MKPIIITDASSDLPLNYIEQNKIPYLGLICHLNNIDFEDDFGKTLPQKEFFKKIKEGAIATTSQINEYSFYKLFKELLKENRPLIYIGMSSNLSGTYNSAYMARENLIKENKNADITLIDTKCASIGQGLLVMKAFDMAEEGANKEQICEKIGGYMKILYHWLLVEDLKHLKRGGRISTSKAAIGSLLNINPVICLDKEGNLQPVAYVRGRKRAIRFLVDKFVEYHDEKDFENAIGISHGDCIENAQYLRSILEEEFKVKNVIITEMGIGLGSHCGSGVLSLCFLGKKYR